MKKKILTLLGLGVFILVMFVAGVSAATLAEWPLTSTAIATSYNPNVDFGSFTATTGPLNYNSTYGVYSADTWNDTSMNSAEFYEVNITPNVGYIIDLSDISFNYSSDQTQTTASFILQYSRDASFSSPTPVVTKTDVNNVDPQESYSNPAFNVQIKPGETLHLRWFGYSFASPTDRFYIKDLKIGGDVTQRFCSSTANSSDLILNIDLKNEGEGDDNRWQPLDTISVEVEFTNNKATDLSDIVFELGLFDSSGKNVADDFNWISKDNEEYEVGDVDAGDDIKHVFEFRVDPSEIDIGENYLLMVKAYPSGKESTTCIDQSSDLISLFYTEVALDEESDRDKMVVIDEKSITSVIEALCGEEVTLTLDIYNIGDIDFNDQFMISLYNKDLKIDLKQTIYEDLDAGDRTPVTFIFRIPQNAEEKFYTLSMYTYYDYDENGGDYETYYDRMSEKSFKVPITVKGGCIFDPKLTITASLESGGIAGEELVVKATITNTDSKTRTFTLTASDYESWAELVKINPTSLTLGAGDSKEVLLTLNVNSDVSGNQTFNIEVLSEEQLIATQPASVLVEKAGFSLIKGITGAAITGENWYLWGIGAFNVILVLIIIIVAVKLVRKK